jgi:hypothetical protein
VGAEAAKKLAGLVDFKTEQVVFVRWQSVGPPFEILGHKVEKGKFGYTVHFHRMPQPATAVGQRKRFDSEFFALPASATVETEAEMAEKEALPEVRTLKVKREAFGAPGADLAVKELKSTKDLEAYGAKVAKEIGDEVDFSWEKVAVVSWGSSGPPFDNITYDLMPTKSGFSMTVRRQLAVPAGQPRKQAYLSSVTCFVIPKSVTVTTEGK